MFKAVSLIVMLVSFNASAKIVSDVPSVNFGLASVSVADVCTVNGNVEAKNEVTFCSEFSRVWISEGGRGTNGYFETSCVAYATKTLSRSLNYTAQKCVRWEGRRLNNICTKFVTVAKTIPTTYSYGVFNEVVRKGEVFRTLLRTEKVSIKACL